MSLRVDGDGVTAATGLKIEGAAAGTAPTATGVTVMSSGSVTHMCHKVRVGFNAVTGFAALTGDVTLWTAPAGAVIERVFARVNTLWAGASITDVDITVGNSAGGNQYLLSFDIDTAALLVGDVVAEIGAGLVDATRADTAVTANAFVATTVQCRFTSVGANLSAMTAGELDVWILYKQLPGV